MGGYRGSLSGIRPDDLAAHVISAAVERTGLDPSSVDDVYMGAANQAGEDNRDVARMGALLAGLPVDIPGVTVNRLCASGLEAVNQASRALRLGEGLLYLAGGVESMSRAPWVLPKPDSGLARGEQTLYDTTLGWRMINPRMSERYSTESMGETGENVAERYEVSREEQDRFALQSHQRAVAAGKEGRFDEQIVPIEVPPKTRRDEPTTMTVDEGPREDTSLEKLAKLKPAFREGGSVTAGNSSTLNDGAACLVLGNEEAAKELDREPMARDRDPQGARAGRPGYRSDRPDRAERGVRVAGPRVRRGTRDRRGAPQRQRRRDRPRPPAGLLGRPVDDQPRLGAQAPERPLWHSDALRRRRPGRGHGRRSAVAPVTACTESSPASGSPAADHPGRTDLARQPRSGRRTCPPYRR